MMRVLYVLAILVCLFIVAGCGAQAPEQKVNTPVAVPTATDESLPIGSAPPPEQKATTPTNKAASSRPSTTSAPGDPVEKLVGIKWVMSYKSSFDNTVTTSTIVFKKKGSRYIMHKGSSYTIPGKKPVQEPTKLVPMTVSAQRDALIDNGTTYYMDPNDSDVLVVTTSSGEILFSFERDL